MVFLLQEKFVLGDARSQNEKIRILKKKDKVLGKSWGDALLVPTRIYTKSILPLIKKNMRITGIAHITGGGLIRNIKRLLPDGCQANISACKWKIPPVFRRLEELGNVRKEEMFRVFNMGIGMVIIVRPTEEKRILNYFKSKKETVFSIGVIISGERKVVIN